jgi:hypothetical protein
VEEHDGTGEAGGAEEQDAVMGGAPWMGGRGRDGSRAGGRFARVRGRELYSAPAKLVFPLGVSHQLPLKVEATFFFNLPCAVWLLSPKRLGKLPKQRFLPFNSRLV